MKKKLVVSISIFVFLFTAAWYIHQTTKRDYIKLTIRDPESISDYIFTPAEVEAETWNFKSREYIKVRKRYE
nr:hypothetical protein [Neobacillus sp. Marseille-Q6967]